MAPLTMTIERVLAFNGLDVLVAQDEGLFAAEGLDLRIARLAPEEMRSRPSCTRGESAATTAGWRTTEARRCRWDVGR
jgi:hypothetical protein